MAVIPTIDLNRSGEAKNALARASSELGVAAVVGHSVDPLVIERAHATAVALFGLPEDVKAGLSAGGMGFRRLGSEALSAYRSSMASADQKETFTARFDDAVTMPWPPSIPDAINAWLAYHRAMRSLAERILDLADETLGLHPGTLRGLSGNPSLVLRALHYPAAGPQAERAGAHTDFGALTLLTISGDTGGLQASRPEGGGWVPIEQPSGAVIMHLGDLFVRWTNGRWIAPLHRVTGAGGERYTLAWFHAPSREAVVRPLEECVEPGTEPRFKPVRVGEYIAARATAQRQAD
jgi:isopenicillin N synthase-like dioxygenase